jgi:hypothetical protein
MSRQAFLPHPRWISHRGKHCCPMMILKASLESLAQTWPRRPRRWGVGRVRIELLCVFSNIIGHKTERLESSQNGVLTRCHVLVGWEEDSIDSSRVVKDCCYSVDSAKFCRYSLTALVFFPYKPRALEAHRSRLGMFHSPATRIKSNRVEILVCISMLRSWK